MTDGNGSPKDEKEQNSDVKNKGKTNGSNRLEIKAPFFHIIATGPWVYTMGLLVLKKHGAKLLFFLIVTVIVIAICYGVNVLWGQK